MALDKLKYTYQDPAKVSELNVDDVLNVTNTINTTTLNSKAEIISPTTSNIGLILKGAALPNSDLMQLQDSTSILRGGINSAGHMYFGSTPVFSGSTYGISAAIATSTTTATFTYSGATQPLYVGQQVLISGVTPSYFNGMWTVTSISGSINNWTFTVSGSGFTANGVGVAFGTLRPSNQLSVTSTNSLGTPFGIVSHPTQQANVFEIFTSSGTRTTAISSTGGATFNGSVTVPYLYSNGLLEAAQTGSILTTATNTPNAVNTSYITIGARFSNQLPLLIKGTNITGGNFAPITGATANGTTITYSISYNSYYLYVGQQITITGVASTGNPGATAGSGFNLTNATIASVGTNQFTVTNSLVDTYTSGGGTSTVQSADLTQWRDGSNNLVAYINFAGAFVSNQTIGTSGYLYSTSPASFGSNGLNNTYQVQVINGTAARIGLMVKAAASQTANIQEWQDSAGTILSRITSSGQFNAVTAAISTLYSGGQISGGTLGYFNAGTFSPAVSPMVVRGAASQTANLQEWQDSTGTVRAYLDSGGRYTSNANSTFSNSQTGGTSILATVAYTTTVPLTVKAVASQTANLQEWQNSAGTVLAKVDKDGNVNTTKSFVQTGTIGTTYAIDGSGNEVTYAANATVDFPNFSGMILIDCQNDGALSLWLCGGGSAPTKIGSSKTGGNDGTMAANSGINGYTWTNANASQTVNITAIRTRSGA